jgi:N utilization substance protein B
MERPDERSDARERALYLLYEAQAKGIDPAATIDLQVIDPDVMTTDLVVGVAARLTEIDAAIADKARDWPLARMPVIDLSVMRLATYELMARPDVPLAVVIDEAVELAKRFSTDNSGRFVNGVLAAIAADVRHPSTEPATGLGDRADQ